MHRFFFLISTIKAYGDFAAGQLQIECAGASFQT